jgi:hypothetical protein
MQDAPVQRRSIRRIGESAGPAQGAMSKGKQDVPDARQLIPGCIVQDDVRLRLILQRYPRHPVGTETGAKSKVRRQRVAVALDVLARWMIAIDGRPHEWSRGAHSHSIHERESRVIGGEEVAI